jgi:uncharacterized membrane protein
MAEAEAGDRDGVDYESSPLTRAEYIAAVVHLYRGELYRANSGRIRLDNTTNWAVLATAGLLTFSFGEGAHSHWILLVGLLLISVFLAYEQRRYRMANVWRSRVRQIEENFYGPILRRDPVSPIKGWGDLVAQDLFHPRFRITRLQALRARIIRNYWPIYAVLVFAWVVKLFVQPTPAENWSEIRDRLGDGLLPWWGSLIFLGGFLLGLLGIVVFAPRIPPSRAEWMPGEVVADQEAESLDL